MTNVAAATVLFDRAPLLAALSYLSTAIVEARNTIPICSCVLIEPHADGARLSGTDLDMIASTIIAAAWDAPGAIAADARDLLAAVRAISGDTVQLQRDGAAVIVAGDGMLSRVEARDPNDWPGATVKPVTAAAAAFSIEAQQLAGDWSRVLRAASFEETRYYLRGVNVQLVHREGQVSRLAFAATDGHRLATVTRDAPAIVGGKLAGCIVPRKMVTAALKALGKRPSGDVSMAIEDKRMALEAGGWSFLSKLIDGTFPDYTRVIPTANSLHVRFDGAQVAALAGAMSKASKGKGACKLTIAPDGGATLEQTHEGNRRAGDMAAEWVGGEARPFVIGMNAKYLADVVANVGGGPLEAHFADAACPILWKAPDAPELVQVLMPMRIDGATEAAKGAKPAAAAKAQPIEAAADVLHRTYGAAFMARDGKAMAAAVAAYRASDDYARIMRADAPFAKLTQARDHWQVAIMCGRARCHAILAAEGGEGRHVKARTALYRAARIVAGLCRSTSGSFKRIGERMRAAQAQEEARAAVLARLERLEGFQADDARPAIPVVLHNGARAFVRLAQLVDVLNYPRVDIVKSDGSYPRRKRISTLHRDDIVRVSQPRGAKMQPVAAVEPVQPAQVVDADTADTRMAALLEQMATLAARVADLEARPAPAAVVTPVALYGPPAPALAPVKRQRSATEARAIQRAWDMRRALRAARADAAALDGAYREALAAGRGALADARQAERRVATLSDRRRRTAARMLQARSNTRTARREARGMATGLAQAQGQLARLQPLADALAGLIAPAATAPAGDNVIQLEARR